MPYKQFLKEHPDLEVIELLLPDINGKLRGKWIAPDKLKSLFAQKLKLPASTLAFDIWGCDPAAWVFKSGDVDGLLVPEASTLTRVPWITRPTAQVLNALINADHTECGYCPRSLVRSLDQRFSELNLAPVVALEMEFSLFKPSDDVSMPVHTQTNSMGGPAIGGDTYGMDIMQEMSAVLDDIHRGCEQQNLPVDTLIKEAGISQYEINLYHQSSGLLAADQAMQLQRLIRGVARQHNMRASFMAKPFADDVGNGMHMHCSVVDKNGRNIFDNGTQNGGPRLGEAIGGVLETLEDGMLLFAPHLNSYKRLQPGCHAPVTVSWGYDNRTVAIRVPNDDVKAIRLEHRISGADANPYLAIAGLLMGVLHGLTNKLSPPAPIIGDAREHKLPELPTNWRGAIQKFEHSELIAKYLGAEFQSVFTSSKRQELQRFEQHISALEYNTYL